MKQVLIAIIMVVSFFATVIISFSIGFNDGEESFRENHSHHGTEVHDALVHQTKISNALLCGLQWYKTNNLELWNNSFINSMQFQELNEVSEGWENY